MRDEAELAREQHEIWEQIAGFWDGHIANEERAHGSRELPIESLLDIRDGMTLLDVGCGNGRFARHAASLGAMVTATDVTTSFIDIARRSSTNGIDYRVLDATDEAQLLTLGVGRFDAAVANMVLMNLATIDPLAKALAQLLKPGGVFVASVPHPCFPWSMTVDVSDPRKERTALVRLFALVERIGEALPRAIVRPAARAWLKLNRMRDRNYLTPVPRKTAAPGQPVPHYNFHRPLHLLVAPFLEAGFAIDALREPPGMMADPFEPELPGLLVLRMRLSE